MGKLDKARPEIVWISIDQIEVSASPTERLAAIIATRTLMTAVCLTRIYAAAYSETPAHSDDIHQRIIERPGIRSDHAILRPATLGRLD